MLIVFGGIATGCEVGHRADRRVVGDAVGVRRQQLGDPGLGRAGPRGGLGEALDTCSYSGTSASGCLTSSPYWPLKSTVSTAPVRATSVERSRDPRRLGVELEAQVRVALEARAQVGRLGGSPRPNELTNATGRRRAPERLVQRTFPPAQREVERRRLVGPVAPVRAMSHSGGSSGHWSSPARCAQKLPSVHSPASGRSGRAPLGRNSRDVLAQAVSPPPCRRTRSVPRSRPNAGSPCRRCSA